MILSSAIKFIFSFATLPFFFDLWPCRHVIEVFQNFEDRREKGSFAILNEGPAYEVQRTLCQMISLLYGFAQGVYVFDCERCTTPKSSFRQAEAKRGSHCKSTLI